MSQMQKQIAALPWRKKKDRVEFLLVTSRETRRWVIPKGWPMEHLADYNAARIEAFEEAGIKGHVRRDAFGTYDYGKRMKDGSTLSCRVHVFAMEVTETFKKWPEKSERKRDWFSVEDASWHVDEQGLKDLIRTFAPS
jgi:8-oxo-dGTP pyrophosphatase MutT (NUDIX family)